MSTWGGAWFNGARPEAGVVKREFSQRKELDLEIQAWFGERKRSLGSEARGWCTGRGSVGGVS